MAKALLCIVVLVGFVCAQEPALATKQVGWMRVVNTAEADFKLANGRYANADELTEFARSHPQGAVKQFASMTPDSIAPYSLRIGLSRDAMHYVAAIKFDSKMQDPGTWCKTDVYSDETGTIDVGQNIGCQGAYSLGAESKPLE